MSGQGWPGDDRVLVCDGAMGTMLHAAGMSLDQSLPAISLSDPDMVRAVHESYLDAGVDIVQTNTFGASRLRLAEYGLGERTEEINRASVALARAAVADRRVLVAGSVSPAVTVQQRRRSDRGERVGALREQIEVLGDAGVDLVLLETFGHLDELLEAVDVALSTVDVPVIAQATFGADARTLSGHSPAEVAAALSDTGITALGANCTLGPQRLLAVARELREHTHLPVTGQPNAGLPRRIGPARFEYDIDAEYVVRYVRHLLEAGVTLVGGCCGTTPTQLAAVVQMVSERRERPEPAPVARTATRPAPAPVRAPAVESVVVELSPEVGGGVDEAVEIATALAGAGVQAVTIASGHGLRPQVNPVDLALHLRHRLGLDTMATVTTWDRTIMALQADLLGAHALGLRRVVCETGRPPLLGDYPHVDGIWDVDSVGLVELLARLNKGVDFSGFPLPSATGFEIGARINPGADLDRAAAQARAKIAAGAQFLVTRPVYAAADLEALLAAIGEDRPPVLVALRPLGGYDEADYLAHEVPDVRIPPDTLRALERAGAGAAEAGLDLAARLAAEVAPLADGIVVVPGRDPLTAVSRILAGLGRPVAGAAGA